MTERKSYNIQLLRGLAIIAVVLIHITPEGTARIWFRPFVNFAVATFVFLSGMLSTADRWAPWKRVKKVLIPYAIWTFVYVAVNTCSTPEKIIPVYLLNLAIASAAPMMYYIFVYCELTLLIPLTDKIARSRFRFLGFIISPMEIILMRILPIVTGCELHPYIKILTDISCLPWFTFFYLGYLLGNGLLKIALSDAKILALTFLGICLQFLEGYWYNLMGSKTTGTQNSLSVVFTCCFLALFAYKYIDTEKYPRSQILFELGNCSFGIYFIHYLAIRYLYLLPFFHHLIFPLDAMVVISISFLIVLAVRKLLPGKSKYLGF